MSRQYANKFNEVLLLRTKNRVEDFHKPTGMTKLMERNEGINRKDFDKFYKDHVSEGIKSRNIRGLFRVPDDNKHLVVDAQEEKDDKDDQVDKSSEQKIQLPFTDEIPVSHTVNYLQLPNTIARITNPSRKPNIQRRGEEEEEVQMIEERKDTGEERRRVDKLPLIGAPGIEPVPGFEDEIYRYEKQPKTIKDYIRLAKNNPDSVIAVMNPLTHEPQFVIKNKDEVTKLYHGNGLSKYYKYFPKDVQKKTGESMGVRGKIASDLYGKWKEDKLDQIRLQEHPVKFDIKNLPDDVVAVTHGKHDDDDDDQDRGGQRIRNAEDFMRFTREEIMKADEETERPLHKEHRDDDDYAGDEGFFSPARSQRSEIYKQEIDYLRDENKGLRKNLDEFLKAYPELTRNAAEIEQHNQRLEFNLKQLEEENTFLKDIEETAKRDFNALKSEYDKKLEELRRTSSGNRQLQEQMNDLKLDYDAEIDRIKGFYQSSQNEAKSEIDNLIRKHNVEINDFRIAHERLEKNITDKDRNIRDLNYNLGNEQAKTRDLGQQMQNLHKDKYELERNLTNEIQLLNQRLSEQQSNFSYMRQQEIINLNQSITQLNAEKQEKDTMYNNLYNQYQTLVQNVNNLPSNNLQAINALQVKDNQNQQYIEQIKNEAITLMNQKDQVINQLTNELNQIRNSQTVIKPEEVKVDVQEVQPVPRINPEEAYRVHEGTRSQGSAVIGEEIVHQVLNEQGSIIWEGKTYKLAGKDYTAPQYALNLIKHNRTNEIKNFKNAFAENQRNAGDRSTYDDKRFVSKAIEILEETANHNKEIVAIVMRRFLDVEEKNISAEFKKRYTKDYERYLPAKYNEVYGKK